MEENKVVGFIIVFFLWSFASIAQRQEPTNKQIDDILQMNSYDKKGSKYIIVITGYHSFYDTTHYYLELMKPFDKRGIICFKYIVDKGYSDNSHFIFCDCKPLDSALYLWRKNYLKTHLNNHTIKQK